MSANASQQRGFNEGWRPALSDDGTLFRKCFATTLSLTLIVSISATAMAQTQLLPVTPSVGTAAAFITLSKICPGYIIPPAIADALPRVMQGYKTDPSFAAEYDKAVLYLLHLVAINPALVCAVAIDGLKTHNKNLAPKFIS